VAIIRFERGMQQGLLTRISRTALMEYHTFGIVSYVFNFFVPYTGGFVDHCHREGVHSKEHYLICGVQGDFTRSLVENPPSRLWTRELKVSHKQLDAGTYRQLTNFVSRSSLQAFPMRVRYTDEEFVSVPAQVSVQRCRLVCRSVALVHLFIYSISGTEEKVLMAEPRLVSSLSLS